jgi:N-hydroxyarylamine O-acetyltransferase
MHLTDYFDRIDYHGASTPTLDTLVGLHRAHLLAITYENLNIHLGRPLVLDEQQIFDKIVRQRRGGWCYEMNGLFAWALCEIGFRVRLLGGAVSRPTLGERANRNHLVLLVELDRPYLADVGFGNGFLEPLPLVAGNHTQGGLTYQLRQEGERWVFHNHAYGGPGFDFTLTPHIMADFADKCHELQTAPDSGFVRISVCHRFIPDGLLSLRGAILSQTTQEDVQTHTITSADEYVRVISQRFDLRIDDLQRLWPTVWERHVEWIQQEEQK